MPTDETFPASNPAERPIGDDPAAWRAFWRATGLPWRTEPEISAERQAHLAERRAIAAQVGKGIYPFGGQVLTRADLEWLLATHGNGRGPVDWSDETQRSREGIDLRGADLRELDLRGLPLARMRGGEPGGTEAQQELASVRLDGARLGGAQLQGAELRHSHLERAGLVKATLEHARLNGALLNGADLRKAQLARADLRNASLREADAREASFERAKLQGAHCEYVRFGYALMDGAVLDRAHFSGSLMQAVSLKGASCKGTNFSNTFLRHAHLEGANLHRVRLEESQLEGAFLHGAEMRGSYLQGTNLFGAELDGKRITDDEAARFQQVRERRPASKVLPPVDLRGAFMDHGTNLRNARLGSPELGYVSVADLSWGGVNLSVLSWTGRGGAGVTLGDEREALRRVDRDGAVKDRATRLEDHAAAVRANRQLAVALRAQGLDEDAARFAYRAQVLQRRVALRQGRLGSYLFSVFLDGLAGYGYKPGRSLLVYVAVILGWAAAYFLLGQSEAMHLSPVGALIFSVTSFHGRGFFPGGVGLDDPLTVIAAAEAIVGLLIELSFIATFTQRFFGK